MSWLDELESKARAATPGPWEADLKGFESGVERKDTEAAPGEMVVYVPPNADCQCKRCDAGCLEEKDAAFIAAANPATVLRMVELLREAERMWKDVRDNKTVQGLDVCAWLNKLERGEP